MSPRGGRRPGAGQPRRDPPLTERMSLEMSEADRAEIEAAVPADRKVGPWIVEAAVMRARSGR